MEKNRLARFLGQSDLGVAAFDGESGVLIFQNQSFMSLFPSREIRHFSDFRESIVWQQPFPETEQAVYLTINGTEHYGRTKGEISNQTWLWVHCQGMYRANQEFDAVVVLVYRYYTGLPPLTMNDPTGFMKVREFLSHDMNSTFMSLLLAIENAQLDAEVTETLVKIVRAAETRRDQTLKMFVPVSDLHELPVETETPSSGLLRSVPEPTRTQKLRLLVVEDDTELLSEISSGMIDRGYDVVSATSGAAALQAVSGGFIPDAALIDLRLGREDGRSVGHDLLQELSQLHIIYMTGFANWAAIASLESVGRVLRKPFSLDLLSSAVREGILPPK